MPAPSLIGSVDWIRAVLLGTVGTAVAVIAIAAVGLLMLSGRLPIRRGLTVVIGCFILFSAGTIADALVAGTAREPLPVVADAPPPPSYTPASPRPAPYDPYAGASVPTPESRPGSERPFN